MKATPSVEGAFYWLNNREVRWRPAEYWKPGTTVEVQVNTYGVDLGDGLFGQENVSTDFTIGDQMITTVDDNTKTLTVRRNGEVIKTMPVSMGKNSTPTNNGVYIVGDRRAHMVMDSSTYGVPTNSPNGYRTEVDWATQISYSGIYVHAAPWSVGSQGYSNVSHGCINVNTSNGKWFYDNAKRGDIVEIVNTVGSTLPGVDGLGDWNIPWEQWKAGNANIGARSPRRPSRRGCVRSDVGTLSLVTLLRLGVVGVAQEERGGRDAGGDADDAPERDLEDQRPEQEVVAQRQVERPEDAVGRPEGHQAGADADHQGALTVDTVDVLLECGGELHGMSFRRCVTRLRSRHSERGRVRYRSQGRGGSVGLHVPARPYSSL